MSDARETGMKRYKLIRELCMDWLKLKHPEEFKALERKVEERFPHINRRPEASKVMSEILKEME